MDHVVIYVLAGDSQRFHGIGSDSKQQTIKNTFIDIFRELHLSARLFRVRPQNHEMQSAAHCLLLPVGSHAVLPMCPCQ